METALLYIPVLVLLSLITLTITSPLNTVLATDMKDGPLEGGAVSETLKITLDKFHSHLSSWKQYFSGELEQDGTLQQKFERAVVELDDVPDNTTDAIAGNSTVNATATDELTFEDYEKKYLVNKTMNLLKQLVLFKEYTKSQKTNDTKTTKASTLTPQNQTVTPSVITVSTTDGNRVDALLARQLRQLNKMSVNQLDEVFHNVRSAARRGTDISISSLCCSI